MRQSVKGRKRKRREEMTVMLTMTQMKQWTHSDAVARLLCAQQRCGGWQREMRMRGDELVAGRQLLAERDVAAITVGSNTRLRRGLEGTEMP
jgi:hypothetical protein